MKRVSVLSAFALITFAAGICQADSLVITYRSGKTQAVVLDEQTAFFYARAASIPCRISCGDNSS
jgi:hypothetical protein